MNQAASFEKDVKVSFKISHNRLHNVMLPLLTGHSGYGFKHYDKTHNVRVLGLLYGNKLESTLINL